MEHRQKVDDILRDAWRGIDGYDTTGNDRESGDFEMDGGFSPTTYGELTPSGARHLARAMGIDQTDAKSGPFVFMDLGSGLGKLVVQAYLEWPSVRRSVGIEIAAERAKSASQAWGSLVLSGEAHQLRNELMGISGRPRSNVDEDVKLVEGDMLAADVGEATHIFLSSLCFGPQLMEQITEKLSKEAVKLQCLATLRALPRSNSVFRYTGAVFAEMTWTGVEGTAIRLYSLTRICALENSDHP